MNSTFRLGTRIGLVVVLSAVMQALVSPALPKHTILADGSPDQTSSSANYTQIANVTQVNIVLVYNSQNVTVTQINLSSVDQVIEPIFFLPSTGGPVSALSGNLDFGTVARGTTGTSNITIQNTGGEPLVIDGVSFDAGSDPSFSVLNNPGVPQTIQPSATVVFTARYAPPANSPGGTNTGTLHIKSNDPIRPDVALPARGTAGVPHLTVTSNSLQFGDVAVDDRTSPHTSDQVLHIANTASCIGCDLTLSSLPIAGPNAGDFYVVGAPLLPTIIGAGSQLDLTVEFNPSDPGSRSAMLSVNSDDPSNPSAPVSLSGNGLVPAISTSPGSLVFGPTVFDPICSGLCGQTLNGSITDNGLGELFLDGLTFSGSSAFSGSGPTSPVTRVEPTNSLLESVTFHPTAGPARAITGSLHVQDSVEGANSPAISQDVPLCGESVGRGIRVLAYLPDGTVLTSLDKLSLQSHGVTKPTNIQINKTSQLQLQTIDPPTSCQRIQFQYENQDLQAVTTAANRGSYYVLSLTAGSRRSTISFTLGVNEFKTMVVTVQ